MKYALIAIAILLSVITLSYVSTNKDERKILNAFADQNRGVPEWIVIDWTNEKSTGVSYQIEYGIGGRTCNSIVEFDLDDNMTELARRCYN